MIYFVVVRRELNIPAFSSTKFKSVTLLTLLSYNLGKGKRHRMANYGYRNADNCSLTRGCKKKGENKYSRKECNVRQWIVLATILISLSGFEYSGSFSV